MNRLIYTWDHRLTSQKCNIWSHTLSVTASTLVLQSIQVTGMTFDVSMAYHMGS